MRLTFIERALRAPVATLLVGSSLLAGCGSTPPAPTQPPTPAASAGVGSSVSSPWIRADVELPNDVTASPSASGIFCSPCHGSASYLTGVTTATFGLIAVGFFQPVIHAAAWSSSDGQSWRLVPGLPASDEGSAIEAVTSDGSRVVAVGRDASGATSWTTTDGATWHRSPASPATSGPQGSTAIRAVIAYRSGFVAGGYSDDPAAGKASAAVWTSPDGLSWKRLAPGDADAAGFAGGRIVALATNGSTIVAVGTTGDPIRGPSAVWVSTDGVHWSSISSPAFALGAMRSVAAGERGFVAVGQGTTDAGAVAWTSSDGRTWEAAPDATSLHHAQLPVRMQAVTWTATHFVAVGFRSDAGNGSAIAWTSSDGRAWAADPAPASFSGSEMTAVTPTPGLAALPPGVIAVGERGLPDNGSASAWIRPG